MKRKKATQLVVRISQELDDILRKDSEAKRTSVSGLVTTILQRYAEWDRLADRYRLISLTTATVRELMEKLSDESVLEIADKTGEHMRGITLFWFKKLNPKTSVATVEMLCRYTGLAEAEIQTDGGQIITLHHELGMKWSLFVGRFLQRAMAELGINVKPDLGETYVMLTLPIALSQ